MGLLELSVIAKSTREGQRVESESCRTSGSEAKAFFLGLKSLSSRPNPPVSYFGKRAAAPQNIEFHGVQLRISEKISRRGGELIPCYDGVGERGPRG